MPFLGPEEDEGNSGSYFEDDVDRLFETEDDKDSED